jgi:hypothetical protein
MSSKPVKTTPKPKGYKAGRTTSRRVRQRTDRAIAAKHAQLDELFVEAVERDRAIRESLMAITGDRTQDNSAK